MLPTGRLPLICLLPFKSLCCSDSTRVQEVTNGPRGLEIFFDNGFVPRNAVRINPNTGSLRNFLGSKAVLYSRAPLPRTTKIERICPTQRGIRDSRGDFSMEKFKNQGFSYGIARDLRQYDPGKHGSTVQ